MYSKLLIIIPVISLLCNCSSNKSKTKENQVIEEKEVAIVENSTNDISTTSSTTKVFSLEKDKKEFKYLLTQHHDKHKKDINLEVLSKKLNSSNPIERQDGVNMLRFFPEYSSLVPKVEELLLNDKEKDIRNECAVTLQLLESKRSIPALIKALDDEDLQVKASTVESLAALGEKKHCFAAADKLWNKGKEGGPVQACQAAFRDIGTPEALERLEYDMNNNADDNIAIGAAIFLAQLGHINNTLPYFEKSLSNEDIYIRMAALRGLSYIANEKALQLIYSKTDDADELVKERALSLKHSFENIQ